MRPSDLVVNLNKKLHLRDAGLIAPDLSVFVTPPYDRYSRTVGAGAFSCVGARKVC
jgi:hypothetical protein